MTTASRLPIYIEQGASVGGARFPIFRHNALNGRSQRAEIWDFRLGQWDISYPLQTMADWQAALDVFMTYGGRPFRFRDWNSYSFTAQPLGTGNGTNTDFPLQITFTSGSQTYVHPVFAPVDSTIVAKKAGVSDPSFTVQRASDGSAFIRFTSAPGSTVAVTADLQIDRAVVFTVDMVRVEVSTATLGRLRNITIAEVLENPDV